MSATPRSARGFFLDPARRPAAALAVGLAALALCVPLAGWAGAATAYLGAWIVLLALPVGALPVVIMIERADAWRPQPETMLLGTLRGFLALMPVAAVLVLPILFALPALYPWARGAGPDTALGRVWFTTPFLVARLAAGFAIWLWLALVFARRGGEPWGKAGRMDDGRAVIGFGLHAFVATVMVTDLVMATAERFHSTLAGLLVMAAWSGLALSAAVVVAPPDIGPSRRRLDRLTPLAVLLAIWAFLHFVQFLISWSANLPDAAQWYGIRGGAAGRSLSVLAGAVAVGAALLTLRPGEYSTRILAALALLVHALEMFWFVTPSIRGAFRITLVDGLALAGVTGLALGLAPLARRLFPRASAPAGTGKPAKPPESAPPEPAPLEPATPPRPKGASA